MDRGLLLTLRVTAVSGKGNKMAKKKHYSTDMVKGSRERAGMPQESYIQDYPKNPSSLDSSLNDGMSGIDSQLKADKTGSKSPAGGDKY